MTIAICMLAGASLGWIGFANWNYSEKRSAMTVGAEGGTIGGMRITPIVIAAAELREVFCRCRGQIKILVHGQHGLQPLGR